MKPRIKAYGVGWWICFTPGQLGGYIGETPLDAYNGWKVWQGCIV